MKIALCQLNSTVGNFSENLDTIEAVVENLDYGSADLFLFPELFLTGYPPQDLLKHQWFIQQGADAIDRLKRISLSIPEKAIVVGIPLPVENESGSHLYNSAIVISNGEVIFSQHKSVLPSYDIFDEHRYFSEGQGRAFFTFRGKSIGLTIGEDLWSQAYYPSNRRQKINPVEELSDLGVDIIFTIAASPFHNEKQRERIKIISSQAADHQRPILFVNSFGANDQLIFDGGSLFVNASGEILTQLPYFKEVVHIIDTSAELEPQPPLRMDSSEAIHSALVLGIEEYVQKCGFSQVVVLLTGGIDSAVTASLAVSALGAENVTALLLPSDFSTQAALDDARKIANNLQIEVFEINISPLNTILLDSLAPLFSGTESGLAEENLQARIRSMLLMATANKFNKLLLCSNNKSELAVGYCTLYGDMSGALSVLGDLYKSDVYRLTYYINRSGEKIPVSVINRTPSAELKANQKDEDVLPPYDDLDGILKLLLEEDMSSDEVVHQGYEQEMVDWIVRAIKTNEYKRHQAAPVLTVTPKAFGKGRRFPIAATYEW